MVFLIKALVKSLNSFFDNSTNVLMVNSSFFSINLIKFDKTSASFMVFFCAIRIFGLDIVPVTVVALVLTELD